MRVKKLPTRTSALALAGGALASCALMLAPSGALADAPPTLSVSLNSLPGGAGYTVTATLSSTSPYDCTARDPSNPTYPDLSWSQDPSQDPSWDAFTGPLSNPANDVTAQSCGASSWTSSADDPLGVPGSDNPPGNWYFQATLYCPLDGTDADCAFGVHSTNVASLSVPAASAGAGALTHTRAHLRALTVCSKKKAKHRTGKRILRTACAKRAMDV
jgi:hypothetical protein